MTIPQEYLHASRDFDRFMDDFLEISMLATRHQSYAVVRAVLHVFRDHLTVHDGLKFAEILPAVLRAIFIENWHPTNNPPPFPDRAALTSEVKANRRDHNTGASDNSIAEVATALRRNVDANNLDRVLAELPAGAIEYWATQPAG
jgi:uncharacterized protein (DUF2267 family)